MGSAIRSCMTNTTADLGRRIEQVIAEHMAAAQREAQQAMARAFGEAAPVTRPRVACKPTATTRRGARRVVRMASIRRFQRALLARRRTSISES